MNVKDLKIGTRLNAGFGVLIVMMLGMATLGYVRFNEVGTINARIIQKDWVKARIETNKQTINESLKTLEELVYAPEGKALPPRP